MSPEQRQEWEDDEDALRRETTESDERSARVAKYAGAMHGATCRASVPPDACSADGNLAWDWWAEAAIAVADTELAEAKREIERLHRDALAEAQAYRAMFTRAQEAEAALLRVRALADSFADDGVARYGGNIAWHIEDVIANEKGDFPDAADQRIASQRERAEAAESKLTAVEALRARYGERAENGCPVSLNYARAHRDLTTALGGGE